MHVASYMPGYGYTMVYSYIYTFTSQNPVSYILHYYNYIIIIVLPLFRYWNRQSIICLLCVGMFIGQITVNLTRFLTSNLANIFANFKATCTHFKSSSKHVSDCQSTESSIMLPIISVLLVFKRIFELFAWKLKGDRNTKISICLSLNLMIIHLMNWTSTVWLMTMQFHVHYFLWM